jgi:hypothetical protein
MEWVTGCAFAISFTADGQCLSGTIEAGYFARYLKGMYLSSLPEGVAGAEIGDGTGLLNGGPNPGDEALLEIGFQQDVVNPNDGGFCRYIVVVRTRNEDNWRGYVAAAQSVCEIDSLRDLLVYASMSSGNGRNGQTN